MKAIKCCISNLFTTIHPLQGYQKFKKKRILTHRNLDKSYDVLVLKTVRLLRIKNICIVFWRTARWYQIYFSHKLHVVSTAEKYFGCISFKKGTSKKLVWNSFFCFKHYSGWVGGFLMRGFNRILVAVLYEWFSLMPQSN